VEGLSKPLFSKDACLQALLSFLFSSFRAYSCARCLLLSAHAVKLFFFLNVCGQAIHLSEKSISYSHLKKLECNTCNFCCIIHIMLASWPIGQSLAGGGGVGGGSGVGKKQYIEVKKK